MLALLPAVWVWLFDTSFWFNYLEPISPWVTPILARIGLAHGLLPDYVYVALAVAIMGLLIAYLVCLFTRWHSQGEGAGHVSLQPSNDAVS